MVSHRKPALPATALVLVLTLVGGACSSSGGQSSGGTIRGPSVVVGEVSAGAPLAGASVTLTTAQGKPLPGVKPSTSLAAGAFAVEATSLPRNFRVVAREGILGARLFTGQLEADVRGWSSTTGDLSVNVGTTLVAAYLSRHSGASLPVATAAVSKFLGVPPTRDFALDVSIGDENFDQQALLAEAERHGGLDSYIATLVRQVGGGRTHRFPGPATNDIELDIAKYLFDSLRTQANDPECLRPPPIPERCKNVPAGDLLRFLSTPTERALAEILNKLDLISSQLEKLNSVVEELRKSLDQNTYNNVVGFMQPEVIERAMKTFKTVGANCGTDQSTPYCATELGKNTREDPGEFRKQVRTAVLNSGVLDKIPDKISGGSGTTGIMQEWPKVVKNQSDYFTVASSKQLLGGLSYFFDVEMSAITLAVNYWRWEQAPEADTQKEIDAYDKAVKAQQAVFSPLPEGTFMHVPSGIMWATSAFCTTYAKYGPRETGQCPPTYAGFPVTDQRLVFPGYPKFPYFTPCTQGSWCIPNEGRAEQMIAGAKGPWEAWLKGKAGVDFKGPGAHIAWLADVQCKADFGHPPPHWFSGGTDKPPQCYSNRRAMFLNNGSFEDVTFYEGPAGPYFYLFDRFPTEQKRYY